MMGGGLLITEGRKTKLLDKKKKQKISEREY